MKFSAHLKIAIDAFPLTGQITGIGRYVLEICRALDIQMPNAQFFLYSCLPLEVELPSERWTMRVEGALISRAASSYTWLKTYTRHMAKADGAHIFWAPRTILPARSRSFRTVTTVHDLNYRIFPKSMPPATLWAHRLWFARDVRRAEIVVANSQGTAKRLETILGIKADAVVRPALMSEFHALAPDMVAERLERLGIIRPYFLAVGTLEPRKNLSLLIDAFKSLKYTNKLGDHALLIAGSAGWRDRRLRGVMNKAREAGVYWLDFVSDADLSVLYNGTTAFVCPSLYEGFGMPVLEARACGTRVIASDIPELREAGGMDGIYVSPTVEGIQSGLLAALDAPVPRPVQRTDWMDAAESMARIFNAYT